MPTTFKSLVAFHEAGYQIASQVLDLPVRKRRHDKLRKHVDEVVDLSAIPGTSCSPFGVEGPPEALEKMALLMLAGRATVRRYCPDADGDRDQVAAMGLVFHPRRPGPR
jgi:hypothetical protein